MYRRSCLLCPPINRARGDLERVTARRTHDEGSGEYTMPVINQSACLVYRCKTNVNVAHRRSQHTKKKTWAGRPPLLLGQYGAANRRHLVPIGQANSSLCRQPSNPSMVRSHAAIKSDSTDSTQLQLKLSLEAIDQSMYVNTAAAG